MNDSTAEESEPRPASAGERIARVEGRVSMLTTNVERLQAAVRVLVSELGAAGVKVDPRVLELLLFDEESDEHGFGDVSSERVSLGAPPPRAPLSMEEHRRALARERTAARRAGVSVAQYRAARAQERHAAGVTCHAPSVTSSVTVTHESVTERDIERDMSRSERDAPVAGGRGFTSLLKTSSSADPSSSSSVTSLPTSPPSQQDHPLSGDHSRARAVHDGKGRAASPVDEARKSSVDARSDAPTGEDTPKPGKRRERATWALVDACARAFYTAKKHHPPFAPKTQSGREERKGSRVKMYDACARGLSRALQLLPSTAIETRFDVVLSAFAAHIAGAGELADWRTFTGSAWTDVESEVKRRRRVQRAEDERRVEDTARAAAADAAQQRRADAARARHGDPNAPPAPLAALLPGVTPRHAPERDASRSVTRDVTPPERDASRSLSRAEG